MPAMLKQDRPVNVTANRLEYDGAAIATYQGSARLWQEQSKIDAGTLILDDRSGDLTARVNVTTTMMLDDTDPKTAKRVPTRTIGTADTFVYDNEKRLAVYTGTESAPATLKGAQGDLSGSRIELYLKESGTELERAEAHGRVTVKEAQRTATGDRLVYTTVNDTYVMTGRPVEVVDREQQACKKTVGAILKFRRAVDTIQGEGAHGLTLKTETIPCPAERRD
jgi:lipopolysaccharide export system protein LptA